MSKLIKPLLALIAAAMMPLAALGETTTSAPAKAEVSTVGTMPQRGMTMEQVKKSFGEPAKIIAAVGKPPISRWVYDGFVVYFESDHVIHALTIAESPQ